MTKKNIKKVLEAETILLKNIRRNSMTPDDLTPNEYLEEITDIVNKEDYRNELIEENELGQF